MNDFEYTAWLNDQSRDNHRLVLIELQHTAGKIYFSSDPWISKGHVIYDSFITNIPFMQDYLDSFTGLGGIEAMNLANDNWRDYDWNGQTCVWLLGDEDWSLSQFRKISISAIDSCNNIGGNLFSFELLSPGLKFQRALVSSDTTKTQSVAIAAEYIEGIVGSTVALRNLGGKESWQVRYDLTPTTMADEVLRNIATSIGANFRIDALGNAEIFYPDNTGLVTLDNNSLTNDGIKMISTGTPYNVVTVIKNDGTRISETTDVDSGSLYREFEITTYLTSTSNANQLLAEKLSYYSNKHPVWQIPAFAISNLIQVGNRVTIACDELVGTGVVSATNKVSLSEFSTLELTL